MNNPISIIDLLAQNENLLRDLYLIYARQLPELADFWSGLAKEEQHHASLLQHMVQAVDDKSVKLIDRFSPATLTTYKTYLAKEIAAAQSGNITVKQALITSLYIEKSLIEKEFFTIFTSSNKELSETLAQQIADTKWHIEKVKQKIKEMGFKSI